MSNCETNVRVFGASTEDQDEVKQFLIEETGPIRDKEIASLKPVKLEIADIERFREVEELAGNFLREKIRNLGISESELPTFPEVHYAQKSSDNKNKPKIVGYNTFFTNVVVVHPTRKYSDLFDDYANIAHELSHSSVRKESRYYITHEQSLKVSSAHSSGAGIIGSEKALGKGIEEGMTIFDHVEFFNTVLRDKYPDKYQKRLKWASPPWINHDIRVLDKSIYGEITPEFIAPFIKAFGPRWPIFGHKLDIAYPPNIILMKEFLFARKLSEIIGQHLNTDDFLTPGQTIERGRRFIDFDRYTRKADFHRKMVEIFGGHDTKLLLQLDAHVKDEEIDSAMKILLKYL